MKIAGLDTETTGLLNPEHRIIEIYIGMWDFETRARERVLKTRIDPERTIAADAQRVHGISSADLVGMPKFKAVAPHIVAFLGDCDLIVAHNGDEFDLPFINMELERTGYSKITTPSMDTMLLGRHATPNGKVPNLGELCFAYDVHYDPARAHAASYDVERMMDCFFKGVDWGWFKLKGAA